ncbi:unnamed protein product [Didymodactylos carnosus]|uniref:Uncharacterized protein n=1 Tax=Didymodactylos carnosus TaxID=1234261 RepID=A0A815LGY8_9BILA|nr:unnamed protein product [Didymodactylos carnosus]CAF1406595.1 unnamed protein product [Didymodactylos carnosus]CAF4151127.1 unnamed protein product [Didymodactylos carnosus]CAF4297644.1 unnamed protein product [Didymodactylos carnosus]
MLKIPTKEYDRVDTVLSLFHKLERLSLNIVCVNRESFIDGYWLDHNRSFLSKLENLIDFRFDILSITSPNFMIKTSDDVLLTFQSDYWLKKGWSIGCFVNRIVIDTIENIAYYYCYVFTLPYQYKRFECVPQAFLNYKENSFARQMVLDKWSNVRYLILDDRNYVAYSIEFFQFIKEKFIHLKILSIDDSSTFEQQVISDR